MQVDFEAFLMEKMVETGRKNIDDDFWDWVDSMPTENIIEYGNQYAKACLRRIGV